MKLVVLVFTVLAAAPVLAQGEYLRPGQWGLSGSAALAHTDGATGPGVVLAVSPSDRIDIRLGLASLYRYTEAGLGTDGGDDRFVSISPHVGFFLAKQEHTQPINIEASVGYQMAMWDHLRDYGRGRRDDRYRNQISVHAITFGAVVSRDLDARPRHTVLPRLGVSFMPITFVEGEVAGESLVAGSFSVGWGLPVTARSTLVVTPEVALGSEGVGFALGLGVVRSGGHVR
jgi:hypothetical protein